MTTDNTNHSEWERVLSTAAFVQQIVPDAILVGGSAAALYAGHRISLDDDHVVAGLKNRFDTVLADLEKVAGWQTSRINAPVLILGNLKGVETGIRNLIREEPLETTSVDTAAGPIVVPTLPELLRIKSWLVVSRNATRDYVDTIALADRLGQTAAVRALERFDALYPQPSVSASQQLMKQLSDPRPYDPDEDLVIYKGLQQPYSDRAYIAKRGNELAVALLDDRLHRHDRDERTPRTSLER